MKSENELSVKSLDIRLLSFRYESRALRSGPVQLRFLSLHWPSLSPWPGLWPEILLHINLLPRTASSSGKWSSLRRVLLSCSLIVSLCMILAWLSGSETVSNWGKKLLASDSGRFLVANCLSERVHSTMEPGRDKIRVVMQLSHTRPSEPVVQQHAINLVTYRRL